MIVAGASFVADYLLFVDSRPDIAEVVSAQDKLAAPFPVEYEVGNVIRRRNIIGELSHDRALLAFQSLRLLRLDLYGLQLLHARAWELRFNATY